MAPLPTANAVYTKGTIFTDVQLDAITPDELVHWFSTKVYGVPDPQEDDHPTRERSSLLEHYKKCLSFYMPNKLTPWNVMTRTGNPTRSIAVNELIKRVKKNEVQQQGKASSARRPLEKKEFEQLITLLEDSPDIIKKYMVTAAAKFQFTMIARIDDTSHFLEEDLKPNPQFDFYLLCRVCWSKNVLEERNAPDQLLLGSNNPTYCILLALGLFLEVWLAAGQALGTPFLFGHAASAKTNKKYISDQFKACWDDPRFVRLAAGPLGPPSNRKFPATLSRRSGCSRDDTDSRGRWRKKRVSDRYVDINLPYPDAKVASVLCIGGPVKYILKNGSGVSNLWLTQNVVPHIFASERIQGNVALVLALPILWACFDSTVEGKMPGQMRNRIRLEYEAIRGPTMEATENPVKKVPLVVTGCEAEVYIDEIVNMDDDGGNHPL